MISFLKSCYDQTGIRFSGYLPCINLSGKQIHDNAEIIPFAARLKIGDIACLNQIGCVLVEILVQVIGTDAIVIMYGMVFWLVRRHLRQL